MQRGIVSEMAAGADGACCCTWTSSLWGLGGVTLVPPAMADMAPQVLLGRRWRGVGATLGSCVLEGCLPLPCGASSSSDKLHCNVVINKQGFQGNRSKEQKGKQRGKGHETKACDKGEGREGEGRGGCNGIVLVLCCVHASTCMQLICLSDTE